MPSLPVLVLNSGSSSIKFSMYEASNEERTKVFEGNAEGIGSDLGEFSIKDAEGTKLVDQTADLADPSAAFRMVVQALNSGKFPAPKALGHRIVCGGPRIQDNQRITPQLINEIESYAGLAPLHTPIAVYIMREALRLFPGVPNYAVLDTYFHRSMPEIVRRMPIPDEYVAMGVSRYGYHGISCESILYQLQPDIPEKLIIAHLGNGASLSAVRDGKCVDTSMGLTPTGGVISASRTGDIDPGVVIFMLRKIAETTPSTFAAADQLEQVVNLRSGMIGVSQLSGDMRELREAIKKGNPHARLAVDKFTSTIAKWIGGYYAELGGLDMLVFTGGIGVNDAASRLEICRGLGSLGMVLDPNQNDLREKAVISADGSPVQIRVIPPAEDLMIVNHVMRLLSD